MKYLPKPDNLSSKVWTTCGAGGGLFVLLHASGVAHGPCGGGMEAECLDDVRV